MTQVTNANFDAEVLKSKEPVLVDFYTDTCNPCRMMAPVLAEIETESNGSLKVVKINAADEFELSNMFRVSGVPAFFAFANGKCVGQTIGAKSKANMKKWFEDSVRTAG
jgi:thioredoxin 1